MINRSIILKQWLAIVLLIMVVLMFLSFGLFSLLEDFYYSQISTDLINSGQKLTEIINEEDDPQYLIYELTLLGDVLDSHIVIVGRDGTTQACDSMMEPPAGLLLSPGELAEVFAGEIIVKRGYHHHHFDGPMLSVAIPVYQGDSVERIIMMFKPIAPITNTINSMRELIIYSAIAAIILASTVSFFLSKTLAKPLVQMNKVANEMAKGDFSNKVKVNSKDEVGLLGASLNNLSNQLKNKISELSHEKSKLEKVLAKERAIEQMRRDFIANVSHELRTPLSLLQGYSEAIIDGVAENSQEQDRYAKVIFQETLRLKRMVNELFDLSRLQTGNFTLSKTKVNITYLLKAIQEKYKPSILKTDLELNISIEKDLPEVDGDYDRLQQVLINLVENALNHTVEGEISIKAYTDDIKQIHVEVSDTGCGIPKTDLDLVWERFHKADKSRNRGNKSGTGLGLAIVKSIIEAHGGNVWVRSKEGEGSTFGFSIPSK
ncbi:MAG: hypothetical protein APF76_14285 [Desulfitibacter sp. BRH_c19]|nr:MAG: hypothetical protein APF76_14285 [Desulfitibacter sp. BRH_c19]